MRFELINRFYAPQLCLGFDIERSVGLFRHISVTQSLVYLERLTIAMGVVEIGRLALIDTATKLLFLT